MWTQMSWLIISSDSMLFAKIYFFFLGGGGGGGGGHGHFQGEKNISMPVCHVIDLIMKSMYLIGYLIQA